MSAITNSDDHSQHHSNSSRGYNLLQTAVMYNIHRISPGVSTGASVTTLMSKPLLSSLSYSRRSFEPPLPPLQQALNIYTCNAYACGIAIAMSSSAYKCFNDNVQQLLQQVTVVQISNTL